MSFPDKQAVTPSRQTLLAYLEAGCALESPTAQAPSVSTPLILRVLLPDEHPTLRSMTITPRQLEVLDTRLPEVLTELIAGSVFAMRRGGRLPGNHIRVILDFWQNEHLVFPARAFSTSLHNEQVLVHQHILAFNDIDVVHDTVASIDYVAFNLAVTPSGVVYPASLKQSRQVLNPDWLNRQVPDWREHLAVAQTLGIRAPDVAHHVFSGFLRHLRGGQATGVNHQSLPAMLPDGIGQ